MTENEEKRAVKREVRRSDGVEYTYELMQSYQRLLASYGIPLYSISVRMRTEENGNTTEYETGALFSDHYKAECFFDRIVDALITPIGLIYAVEDELE